MEQMKLLSCRQVEWWFPLKMEEAQRLILEVDDEDDNLFANILRLSCVNIQT